MKNTNLRNIQWEEKVGKEDNNRKKEKLNPIKKTIGSKGVSWIERYGEKRTKQMKKNLAEKTRIKFKGKPKSIKHRQKIIEFGSRPYEEKWGKETADRVKKLRSISSSRPLAERIGEKRAKEIIEKRAELSRKRQKGKTYEEIHGVEKAKILRAKKRRTLEEKVGKERAEEIKIKRNKKLKKWNNNDIIKKLQNIVKYNGLLSRTEIWNLSKKVDFCSSITIGRNFGNVDNLAKLANIELKERGFHSRIGKNEKMILDDIEKEKGIKLIRQFSVAGKFIDGYDRLNNTAYEVDEQFHKYRNVEDDIRQQQIQNEIGCEFIRIKDTTEV